MLAIRRRRRFSKAGRVRASSKLSDRPTGDRFLGLARSAEPDDQSPESTRTPESRLRLMDRALILPSLAHPPVDKSRFGQDAGHDQDYFGKT
jgi:hypothetical protein